MICNFTTTSTNDLQWFIWQWNNHQYFFLANNNMKKNKNNTFLVAKRVWLHHGYWTDSFAWPLHLVMLLWIFKVFVICQLNTKIASYSYSIIHLLFACWMYMMATILRKDPNSLQYWTRNSGVLCMPNGPIKTGPEVCMKVVISSKCWTSVRGFWWTTTSF